MFFRIVSKLFSINPYCFLNWFRLVLKVLQTIKLFKIYPTTYNVRLLLKAIQNTLKILRQRCTGDLLYSGASLFLSNTSGPGCILFLIIVERLSGTCALCRCFVPFDTLTMPLVCYCYTSIILYKAI